MANVPFLNTHTTLILIYTLYIPIYSIYTDVNPPAVRQYQLITSANASVGLYLKVTACVTKIPQFFCGVLIDITVVLKSIMSLH